MLSYPLKSASSTLLGSCRAEAEAELAQPCAIGDGGAVRAQMQFRLEVERQQLRALRLDDGDILPGDLVLEGAYLLVGLVTIVQPDIGPCDRDVWRDRCDGEIHGEARSRRRLDEIGRQRAQHLVGVG